MIGALIDGVIKRRKVVLAVTFLAFVFGLVAYLNLPRESDPNINFAMMAKSMGMYAEGPVENPKDLGPALKRAIAVVKKGEPALIDVVSQGR